MEELAEAGKTMIRLDVRAICLAHLTARDRGHKSCISSLPCTDACFTSRSIFSFSPQKKKMKMFVLGREKTGQGVAARVPPCMLEAY